MVSNSVIPWSRVTPTEFEELCQVVLGHLGLTNIRRLGGPGDRGRDIVGEYPIKLGSSLSFSQGWLVQCKHTKKKPSIDLIEKDLRRAAQHQPDVWLLMTSNTLSSATQDWLYGVGDSSYNFRVNVLDGTELARILDQEPRLLPGIRNRLLEPNTSIGDIYYLMMEGKYAEALAGIQEASEEHDARLLYLKACCCSELARRHPKERDRLIAAAFECLSKTLKLDYVSEVSRVKGWPKEKVFVEMQMDPELEFIKESNLERFICILEDNGYSAEREAHGCLAAGTLVLMNDGHEKDIADVAIGDVVASPRGVLPGPRVLGRACYEATEVCRLNNELTCSLTQPLLVSGEWLKVSELRYGDVLSTVTGSKPLITMSFDAPREVHMIRLSSGHDFIANGYVVHNKF